MTDDQRIRFAEALKRVAGEEDTLQVLAQITSEDAPELLSNLDDAIANEDTVVVAQIAHALKGMLSVFETGDPVSELQPIIDAARRRDVESMRSLYRANSRKIQALLNEIDAVSLVEN
ncbi:Hpt domain-containing protein [Stieleria varia]|uniref:Hpt domain protein n=1 Tax=Stieleria varia TaxID=2528005 RepID=A0A5C6B8Y7_9BACT|nr:Hpt domain-containing protein [Stieleria varia]TWU08430.1 Hpt domain protein [Stieleria varia]